MITYNVLGDPRKCQNIEMFYLNTIEQLVLFVEQLYQLEVCLPYIPIQAVFQNMRNEQIELFSFLTKFDQLLQKQQKHYSFEATTTIPII